ncbi:MAG: (Fe-S)-binding protein [Desulfatirhabdiaceae bacterium]
MTPFDELIRLMKELEDQLVVCMKCGMCQSVCPLYAQTGRESDVARGKLALLDGLMKKMLDDPAGVSERLNKCLLCGSCAAACPSGVHVMDIFIKARAILAGYMGLSPAKRLIFRGMLANPALFDRLTEWGAVFQNLFTKKASDIIGTSCARVMSPLIDNRHFMPLAKTPFHRMVPSRSTPAGASGIRVAFFTGCLIDKLFPNISQAGLQVLDFHGVGVFLPENQGCCGIPAISSGDLKTFYGLVRHNIRQFETDSVDYLVTACATCTSTIKKVWPVLLESDDTGLREKVRLLSEKTLDISQFLAKHVGLSPIDPPESGGVQTVTYHDPCHLKKSLGVSQEPRQVIRASRGWKLTEMADADTCCGMGGSFNLQYYEISAKIGDHKRQNIIDTGCRTVATGCPACMMQISDRLSRAGNAVSVKHVIEIYAESLAQS